MIDIPVCHIYHIINKFNYITLFFLIMFVIMYMDLFLGFINILLYLSYCHLSINTFSPSFYQFILFPQSINLFSFLYLSIYFLPSLFPLSINLASSLCQFISLSVYLSIHFLPSINPFFPSIYQYISLSSISQYTFFPLLIYSFSSLH